jgi:uncharacterized protein
MYAAGQGVPQDYREAARWYQSAAEQGQLEAEYNLGVLYAEGQGVLQDYRLAARWYRLAAEQGERDAQLNLAALYATGKGVAQDYIAAYQWLELAARGGESDAERAKERIAGKMTSEQINQARASAATWQPCRGKQECDERTNQ